MEIETNGQSRDAANRETTLKERVQHIEALQIALLTARDSLPHDMRTDMDDHLCDKLLDAESELAEVSLALDLWVDRLTYTREASGRFGVGA